MPMGGIADEILMKDGDKVEAGQVLMRLDTKASEQKRKTLQGNLQLMAHGLS